MKGYNRNKSTVLLALISLFMFFILCSCVILSFIAYLHQIEKEEDTEQYARIAYYNSNYGFCDSTTKDNVCTIPNSFAKDVPQYPQSQAISYEYQKINDKNTFTITLKAKIRSDVSPREFFHNNLRTEKWTQIEERDDGVKETISAEKKYAQMNYDIEHFNSTNNDQEFLYKITLKQK